MSENILVVEYEPRYTDRVRQALTGQPFTTIFARDGEEAIRMLEGQQPRLIVLSSVVPKISTSELIRAIRGRKPLQETPILLTVSGYNGKSPRQDAQRVGASDILPKPYSESEFLGKVQQMLGARVDPSSVAPQWAAGGFDPDMTVRTDSGQFTSNEIFGDLVDDDRNASAGARKPMSKNNDVDKMLADTLAGVLPQKKKDATATPAAPAAPAPEKRSAADVDKILNDTLSGLEKKRTVATGSVPVPPAPAAPAPPRPAAPPVTPPPAAPPQQQQPPRHAAPTLAQPMPAGVTQPPPQAPQATPPPRPTPVPPPAAPPQQTPPPQAPPKFTTEKMNAYVPDRVPVSQPILQQHEVKHEIEEDPADGTRFGQYVLVEKIATGGMAEVWKARMRGVEGFQKIVAIKKILPHLSDNQDFIEMFVDEAKLAAQLNHNNIIHIYDLGKIQSSYYIAMEYIDGYDLKTILKRGGDRDQPMTVELALFIASKIAAALDYAHRKRDFEDKEMGIVHRDVSPQNVLISQEGDIKLCDFGIAKAASKASHTQAGALKGKLQYMSPEQAWGRSIDRRSDIFALAAVLFEMLTGRKLFTGDNELSILEQVREARVVTPSDINDEVTPDIDRIVLKALQKDPAQRYQSASELARDLDAILYSFKPTPTSADLAIYMHRIWSPEPEYPVMEPEPVPEPPKPVPAPAPVVAAPVAIPQPVAAPPVHEPAITYEQPKKKSPIALIAIALVVIVGGAGAYFATRGGDKNAAKPAAPTSTAPANAGTVAPVDTAATGLAATSTAVVPATGTTASIDPSLVDQEVAKRLAAERSRLEQQARTQQQQAAARNNAAAPVTAAPAPTATQAAVQPPPAPVQTQTQAPAQVTQTQPPPTATQAAEPQRPAPVQSQPAEERLQEGDLVGAGTPGVTAARILRRAIVPYPPIARSQRIEGVVVTSVLVSEKGQPLEVRVIRGINRAVGLNEAAEQTMRRSTFSPATKDGIRLRMWITVPVEFKL